MNVELRVGEEKYQLMKNGELQSGKYKFDGLASMVPVFMYTVSKAHMHIISLRALNEEQSAMFATYDLYNQGICPFESQEEEEAFMDKFEEMNLDGIYNEDFIKLGGATLSISNDKFLIEYEFDGYFPSEKISIKKDGEFKVLSYIAEDYIHIEGLDGTICRYTEESGISSNSPLVEFARAEFREEALTSLGVLVNEFGNHGSEETDKLLKAYNKLYKQAYTMKENALRHIVSCIKNNEGNDVLLHDIEESRIDEVLEEFPDLVIVFS